MRFHFIRNSIIITVDYCSGDVTTTCIYRRSTPSKTVKANDPVKREGPKVRRQLLHLVIAKKLQNCYLIKFIIPKTFEVLVKVCSVTNNCIFLFYFVEVKYFLLARNKISIVLSFFYCCSFTRTLYDAAY